MNSTNAPVHLQRSKKTVSMVRLEMQRDGKQIKIQANLPVGIGWNDGKENTLQWQAFGWIPEDTFNAEQHKKEVASKRDEDTKGKK
jgi:hypothetical protein